MRIEMFFVGWGRMTVKRTGWGRYDKLFTEWDGTDNIRVILLIEYLRSLAIE